MDQKLSRSDQNLLFAIVIALCACLCCGLSYWVATQAEPKVVEVPTAVPTTTPTPAPVFYFHSEVDIDINVEQTPPEKKAVSKQFKGKGLTLGQLGIDCISTGAILIVTGMPKEEGSVYLQAPGYPEHLGQKPEGQTTFEVVIDQYWEDNSIYVWMGTGQNDEEVFANMVFETHFALYNCEIDEYPTEIALPTETSTPTPTNTPSATPGMDDGDNTNVGGCNVIITGNNNSVVIDDSCKVEIIPATATPSTTPTATRTLAPLWTPTPLPTLSAEEWDENPLGYWQTATPTCTPTPECSCR